MGLRQQINTSDLTIRESAETITTRGYQLRADSVNESERSVRAVFATEDAVQVRDPSTWQVIDEVLRMDGCVLPTPNRIPLLNNHYRYSLDDVLGSGRAMQIENKQLIGTTVFADKDELAERAWNKAKQGHLTDVSIGYRVLESVDIPPGQAREVNGKTYTAGQRMMRVAVRWQPREISLVPVGADPNAKIRGDSPAENSISPATATRSTAVPKALRQYLETLGLRSDADESAAWTFFRTLTGEQRTRADSLAGDSQPPASSAPAASTPPAATEGTRQASPPPSAPAASIPGAAPAAPATDDQIRAGQELERRRQARLRDLAGSDVPADLLRQAIDEGWDEQRAAPAFLESVRTQRRAPAGHSRSHEQDCNLAALQAAILVRGGSALDRQAFANPIVQVFGRMPAWLRQDVNAPARQQAMEFGHRFAGMSLVDLCREAVRIDGHRVTHDNEEMIRSAVSGGTLSAIFSTAVNAELLGSYVEAPDSTRGWVDEADVPDFRSHERSAMGKFGALTKHARGGEADHLDMSDSKETSKLARYSGQFVVDEMDIIDDRFGALDAISPSEMGFAAASLRPDLIYAILLANAALDADSVALFHSTHANTDTNAFSATYLETGIAKMSKQRIRSRPLNVRARYLLVPHDLRFSADIALTSAQRFDGSSTGTAGGVKNPLAELGIVAVADDRLGAAGVTDPSTGTAYTGSATNWYLSARPRENGAKTLVCKYRRGTGRAPQIRSFMLDKGRWGLGWDVVLDIGADADDYRGLYRGNT